MKSWTTDAGEGSKYFDTSLNAVPERANIWAKANGIPEGGVNAVFQAINKPGSPFELVEGFIRTSDGSTQAPHLRGPSGQGQKYRHFKQGPHVLPDLFKSAVQQFGKQDFIAYKGPGAAAVERYTFQGAYEAAEGLAAWLVQELGLQKGDRVAQLSRNTPEWILSFMATAMAGGVAMPTNSLWVPSEIEYGMNDSGTSVVFVDGERAANILPLCREGKLPKLKAVVVSRDPAGVAAQGGGPVKVMALADVLAAAHGRKLPRIEVSPEDDAFIMYTSGTTGNPKGVVSTQRSLLNALRHVFLYATIGQMAARAAAPAPAKGASPPAQAPPAMQSAVLCPVPLFHATGSHAIFLLSLLLGRKIVLMHKWDALEALKLVEGEKVTDFVGVPTMSMELISHADYKKYDVSSLKSIGGGGAAPPAKLSAETAKKGKAAGQGWGLTESNALTVNTFSSKEYVENPSSCGRAQPLVDVKIVDDNNQELPPGSPGEVLIRGVTLLKEYWNKPGATAEAISLDGWFRTGDIGRLDPDGALYIMDRAKDLIIRGGENISCAEVESAIFEHPSVQECSVFGMPDERLGEVVAAAIVRKEGAPPFTFEEMLAFAGERLAKFKVPSELYLWKKGEILPRGATGKIPKREIKQQIKDGKAACDRLMPGAAPQSKL